MTVSVSNDWEHAQTGPRVGRACPVVRGSYRVRVGGVAPRYGPSERRVHWGAARGSTDTVPTAHLIFIRPPGQLMQVMW